MRLLYLSLFCALLISSVSAQEKAQKPEEKSKFKIDKYWFVIIKTGPKTDFDSVARAGLFKGHMANMDKLHKEGILKVAGPFGKNDFKWRGIFILDCKTLEEAEKFTKTDPAVAADLFSIVF